MNAPDESGPQPLILGAQLAAAQAAEARHQAAAACPDPKEPSPLAEITYNLPPDEPACSISG